MTKTTFENLKKILTSHRVYANGTDYSLSLYETIWDDFEYRYIMCFPNSHIGSFHDGYARFFCEVADILGCSCSFSSVHGVCVVKFH